MASVTPSTEAANAAKNVTAAMGFLSSLSAFTGTGVHAGAGSSLFDDLLADANDGAKDTAATTQKSAAGLTGQAVTASVTPAAQGLGDIMAVLRQLVNKYRAVLTVQAGVDAHHAAANTQPPDTKSSRPSAATPAPAQTTGANNDPATTTTAGEAAAITITAPKDTAAQAGPAATDDSATTDDTAPSLADILAQLQLLMQVLQQRLQATPAGATADASAVTGVDQALPGADTMMKDLLQLMQAMHQALGQTTSDDTAKPIASTGLTPQARTGVKALLDSLQAAMTGRTGAAVPDAAALTADAAATRGAPLPPDSASLAQLPAAPAQIMQTAVSAADDLLRQFTATLPVATPVAVPAAGAITTTLGSSTDGDSLDLTGGKTSSAPAALPVLAGVETTRGSNPYSFASQLTAAKALTAGAAGLPPAVEQVMLQLSRNVKSGNDQMSIQLHPAELGRVDVRLTISPDGKVQGTVMASSQSTLDLLTKDAKGLERALQDAGLTTDASGLQFSLNDQSGNAQQKSGDTRSNTRAMTSGDDAGMAIAAIETEAETYYVTPGRVNLKV